MELIKRVHLSKILCYMVTLRQLFRANCISGCRTAEHLLRVDYEKIRRAEDRHKKQKVIVKTMEVVVRNDKNIQKEVKNKVGVVHMTN